MKTLSMNTYVLISTYFAVVHWYVVLTIFIDSFHPTSWRLAYLAIGLDLGVTAYTPTIAIDACVPFAVMYAVIMR